MRERVGAPPLSNAMLQGLDWTDAQISSGVLAGAAVSLPQGVPLFVMPSSYVADLTPAGLPAIASYFNSQGWPLGSSATIGAVTAWSIDNSSDTTPNATHLFAVRLQNQQLSVSDGVSGRFLFNLPGNLEPLLNQAHPPQPVIAQFQSNNYHLAATADVATANYWQIANSNDTPSPGPVTYAALAIYTQQDGLHVYGATLAWLRAYPAVQQGIAFSATVAIAAALNPQTTCPNGYPMSAFQAGEFTWEQMLTVPA